MEFEKVVKSRHSVRNFTDQAVSKQTICEIIEIAQQSPSWFNSQPWKVYVAMDKLLENIKTECSKNNRAKKPAEPDFPVMDRNEWNARTKANMEKWRHDIVHHLSDFDDTQNEAGLSLYNAPVILYLTIPKNSSLWSVFDAGSFGQTIMLTAKDMGLDTLPNYNSVRFPKIVRHQLGIPDSETLVVGISLGYAKDATPNTHSTGRATLDDVLKFNN